MSPNAQVLSYFQSSKNATLLLYGFAPSELPLTEVAPMASVLSVVELGRLADLFTDEFLQSLKQMADKPFALCLYTGDGWLFTAVPFEADDASFQQACQQLVQLVNPLPCLNK